MDPCRGGKEGLHPISLIAAQLRTLPSLLAEEAWGEVMAGEASSALPQPDLRQRAPALLTLACSLRLALISKRPRPCQGWHSRLRRPPQPLPSVLAPRAVDLGRN